MEPDPLRQTWQNQELTNRLAVDPDQLVKTLQRSQQELAVMILLRDIREVGTALILIPVWLFLGWKSALPWMWYLMIPALVWVAGFLLVDRIRNHRRPPDPDQSIRQRVETSITQLDHQIWLLRNIFWWYLLPILLGYVAFVGQVSWQLSAGGWPMVVGGGGILLIGAIVFGGIYWLNQLAVRTELLPRRQKFVELLASLEDESP